MQDNKSRDRLIPSNSLAIRQETRIEKVERQTAQEEKATILLVDDDRTLCNLLSMRLTNAGYKVLVASDGLEGLKQFFEAKPSLVILDIMMPKLDGWEVCRRIREVSSVPVLMLTAKGQERDELQGLSLGADDYLSKPFSYQKLLARLEAALRRSQPPNMASQETLYRDGAITIDHWRRTVHVRGKQVDLRPLEYRLLVCFTRNAEKVLTHQELLEQVWGPNYDSPGVVKLYVSYLRRKIELDPENPKLILSMWGVGYRYQTPGKSTLNRSLDK